MPLLPPDPYQRALRPLSPKTERDYAAVLKRAYPLGDAAQGQPAENLKSWPESTRKILRAALRSFWAHRDQPDLGLQLAAKIPKLYQVKKKVQYPTEEEMVAFEQASAQLKPRLRPLMMLLARMGFRAKELLMLSREQVERAITTGEIFFEGKGGEEGSLPVSHARHILQDLLASPSALPHSNERMRELMNEMGNGGPPRWETVGEVLAASGAKFQTRYNLLGRLVKRTAELAGLDPVRWSPHKLRHGFASRMNRDGAPSATIQKALRHKNLMTTQRYIHATTTDVDKFMRR